jgi:hypothetical protein
MKTWRGSNMPKYVVVEKLVERLKIIDVICVQLNDISSDIVGPQFELLKFPASPKRLVSDKLNPFRNLRTQSRQINHTIQLQMTR